MMADSSTQHGRDFEHTVVLSIGADILCDTFQRAEEMYESWRLGPRLKNPSIA